MSSKTEGRLRRKKGDALNLKETKRTIGARIADIRESQGISQRQFSLMIELDRVTLSRIENGIGNPTIETLQRIADGLGIDIADFMAVKG